MTLRARTKLAADARGASVMIDATQPGSGAETVRIFLQRLRTYRNVLTLVVIFGLCYSQRHWLVAWVDHPIEAISAQGETRYLDLYAVESALQPWLEQSFMLTDLGAVKAAAEALPWVDQARVSRLWPGKLQIDVVEQVPVVAWNAGAFLNPRGDVFAPEHPERVSGMVKLVGPEDANLPLRQQMLTTLAEIQAQLDDYGFSAVALRHDARGTWQVGLAQGPEVALGEAPFEEKLERLAQVWEYTPDEAKAQIQAIDTRYPNGVAVRWRDAQTNDGDSAD